MAELVLVSNSTGDGTVPQRIPLDSTKETIIGRGANCDVIMTCLQISRRHCTLKCEVQEEEESPSRHWFITDLSTNGLTIGPQPPPPPPTSSTTTTLNPNPPPSTTIRPDKNIATRVNHNDYIQLVPNGTLIYRFKVGLNQKEPEVIVLEEIVSQKTTSTNSKRPHPLEVEEEEEEEEDDKENKEEDEEQDSNHEIKKKKKKNLHEEEEELTSLVANQKRQIDKLQTELQMAKLERILEREEQEKKEGLVSEQLKRQVVGLFETELACCVCNGVFIEPTISPSCGHTYCHFCITEWLKKKAECPICRAGIFIPPKRHVEVGNLISGLYSLLGEEWKTRRDELVEERRKEQAAVVVQVQAQAAAAQQQQPYILLQNLVQARGGGRRGGRRSAGRRGQQAQVGGGGGVGGGLLGGAPGHHHHQYQQQYYQGLPQPNLPPAPAPAPPANNGGIFNLANFLDFPHNLFNVNPFRIHHIPPPPQQQQQQNNQQQMDPIVLD